MPDPNGLTTSSVKIRGRYIRVCGKPGRDVDHKDDYGPHDHRLENLRYLCVDCHKRRTSQQGGSSFIPMRRKPPIHPSLR